MRKKSICIVSAQFLPHVGGVEQYVDNFSKELLRLGHSVTIITSEMEGVPEYEKRNELEIYRMPTKQMMNGRFPILKYNKKVRQITKELKSKKFDIMLVNARFYFLSLYAVRLAKKMNVRCIMLDHGTSHLNTGGKLTSKLGEMFEHGITWLEKRYCKEFAGVSKATLDWIKHFNINSELVLYNAIDIDSFEAIKKEKKTQYREKYNISKNDIVVSFVGRMTIEKGIKNLVEAINKINESRKDIWLMAVGDGYLMDELKSMKSDNVHLLGKLPIEEVVSVLQECDIFCLPSVSEGFPTSVMEAMVCNNFVITTYRGGAKEIITDKNYGIILKNNESKNIYAALNQVVDDKEYIDSATKLSYNRVLENYTWKQTVQKFLSLLGE